MEIRKNNQIGMKKDKCVELIKKVALKVDLECFELKKSFSLNNFLYNIINFLKDNIYY
jgi:hypothetical protein